MARMTTSQRSAGASRWWAGWLAVPVALAASAAAAADGPIVSLRLLTGQPSGLYYEVGSRLDRLVNAGTLDHRLMLTAEVSPGASANVVAVADGRADLAIVQSDVLALALAGEHPDLPGRRAPLEVLLPLHREALVVVTHRALSMGQLADLDGRRVGFGEPGSGSRTTIRRLLAEAGFPEARFASVSDGSIAERANAFCRRELDAVAFVIGEPTPVVGRLLARCQGVLMPVSGPTITRITASEPYYSTVLVPAGTYPSQTEAVSTIAMTAVLVPRADLGRETIERLTRALLGPPAGTRLLTWGLEGEPPLTGFRNVAPLPVTPEMADRVSRLPSAEPAEQSQ